MRGWRELFSLLEARCPWHPAASAAAAVGGKRAVGNLLLCQRSGCPASAERSIRGARREIPFVSWFTGAGEESREERGEERRASWTTPSPRQRRGGVCVGGGGTAAEGVSGELSFKEEAECFSFFTSSHENAPLTRKFLFRHCFYHCKSVTRWSRGDRFPRRTSGKLQLGCHVSVEVQCSKAGYALPLCQIGSRVLGTKNNKIFLLIII